MGARMVVHLVQFDRFSSISRYFREPGPVRDDFPCVAEDHVVEVYLNVRAMIPCESEMLHALIYIYNP